jgi:hypothetical protein
MGRLAPALCRYYSAAVFIAGRQPASLSARAFGPTCPSAGGIFSARDSCSRRPSQDAGRATQA